MTAINPSVNDTVVINDATVPAKNGKRGVIVRVPDNTRPLEGTNRFKVQLESGETYITRNSRDLHWPLAVDTNGLKLRDRVTVNFPDLPAKHGKSGFVSELPAAGNDNRYTVQLDGGGTFRTHHATNLMLTSLPSAPVAAPAAPQRVAPVAAPVQAPPRVATVIDSTFALGAVVRVFDASVPAKNGEHGEVEETPAMREDRRYKVRLNNGDSYFTTKATDLILVETEGECNCGSEEAGDTDIEDVFSEGDRVMVSDLSVPGKNGRRGVVVGIPSQRKGKRYKVQLDNGESYWTGNSDDLVSSTAALAGANAKADRLESPVLESDLKEDRTVAGVLRSTLEDNKANAILTARVEAGKLIIKQITSRIKPLLPMYAQGYLEHQAAGLVIANLISFSQKQWLPDNAKAAVIADCAMKAAMLEAGAALHIPDYINDAINGALAGFDFSKLGA